MKTNLFIFICFLMFLLKSPLFAQNLNVRYSIEGDFTITDFWKQLKKRLDIRWLISNQMCKIIEKSK